MKIPATLIKKIVPFIGYKSIRLSSPMTEASSLVFIRDKQDIFSFSIDALAIKMINMILNRKNEIIFFLLIDWVYSKMSL